MANKTVTPVYVGRGVTVAAPFARGKKAVDQTRGAPGSGGGSTRPASGQQWPRRS